MKKNKLVLISALTLITLAGCGGGGGGSTPTPATNAVAAGVWQGTSSSGYTVDLVVLPNNSFATIFGTSTGNGGLNVVGFDIGSGTISGSTLTATGMSEFTSAGYVASGNVTATIVNNTSLIGSASYSTGTNSTFNLTPLTGFNYSTPASLATIAGSWTGTSLGGATTVTINSTTGAVAGTVAGGCSFTGTITPSTVNAYTTSITIGASPCTNPNTTINGIGVAYPTTSGTTQLIVEAGSGTVGSIFLAQR